jgi:hypothetical protein
MGADMKKMVDGAVVDMTTEEIAALQAAAEEQVRLNAISQPLSAAQLAAALLLLGKITAPEARAFGRSGEVPTTIMMGVVSALTAAGLSADQRELALIKFESATDYHRDNPLTLIIGGVLSMDAAALDTLWITGHQV